VPPLALALALGAAVFHAAWNLLLARSRDSNASLAVAMVVGPLVLLPIALLRWRLEAGAVPFVVASSALELAYFAMLAWAYRRAELSLIYPIARGLAPVLVLVGSVVFLGVAASVVQTAGVGLVCLGVLLVRGLRAPARASDVAIAATIALLIASYTLIDQQGLRFADPLPYLVLVVGIPGSVYLGVVALHGGRPRIRAAATPAVMGGGISVVAGYGLVLAALTIAHAASVAAVREVSVVIATALAAIVLHERVSRSRWIGSLSVVAGIALVVAA
jgi:drug/metabolite transporter (DMT)-like permease